MVLWRNLRPTQKFWSSLRCLGSAVNPNCKALDQAENRNVLYEVLFDLLTYQSLHCFQWLISECSDQQKGSKHHEMIPVLECFITIFSFPLVWFLFLFIHLVQKLWKKKNDLFFAAPSSYTEIVGSKKKVKTKLHCFYQNTQWTLVTTTPVFTSLKAPQFSRRISAKSNVQLCRTVFKQQDKTTTIFYSFTGR